MVDIRCFWILSAVLAGAFSQSPVYIGRINITLPGFSTIYEHPEWTGADPTERYSLLLSTFSAVPFTRDSSFIFLEVGKFLDDLDSFVPTELYDDFTWPREPSQTPVDVFGFETITQPDGFLPFGKNDGTVFVIDVRDFDNPLAYDIARNTSDNTTEEWFYHRVTWKDVNLDGRIDALTCRARRFGIPSTDETQMLWYEQPESNPFGQPWTAHVMNENICGTFQEEVTLNVPGEGAIDALFTVGYFTQTFAVHWTTDPTGSWENPDLIQTRIIDTGHQFFDMDFFDVNQDGRLDIMMTWNREENGSFVAYEIPDDFRTGEYVLHVLADGFNARSGLFGGGTPGTGQYFYPTTDESGKPWVLLSGDDDGRTYYMTPNSEDPLDWGYELITIRDEGESNIMGRPSALDVNGNGYKEIFIPVYFGDALHVYEFAP